jgi:5'-deoxynucleotidase YfbR-like HD superfamily hydrolase
MAGLYLFLELIERLKDIERRDWVLRGVQRPESVGDHMYRMAITCLATPGVSYIILLDFLSLIVLLVR